MLLEHGFDHRRRSPTRCATTSSTPSRSAATSSRCSCRPRFRKRPPYYVTSFEKVPGTVVGNALPDILADIEEATNAALRSLINNMSIASGPQVVVNDDRIAENENGDDLYPWKRWHTVNDPLGNNATAAGRFFQPNSNAQELLGVYEKFTQIADELSCHPALHHWL